jgi:hypothetical protein
MYSLVNAPVLAYDLVRHPSGPGVCAVLMRILRLTESDLPMLAEQYADDEERKSAWAEVGAVCDAAPRMVGVLASVADSARTGGTVDLREAAELLAAAQMGDLADLLSAVRGQLLDWTWKQAGDLRVQSMPQAVAVICDGVAGYYTHRSLSPAAANRLQRPWRVATAALPDRGEDFGPPGAAVRSILVGLSRAGSGQLAALDAAVDRARRTGFRYAPAMHNAAWAAVLSGRERTAAAAQLATVRAMPTAEKLTDLRLAGAFTAASCAVAAACVADLLDQTTCDALTGPWRTVFGDLTGI